MPNNRVLRDTQLKVTGALPASTTATVSGTIDLGSGARGDFVAPVEMLVTAPALLTAALPDGKTMTYTLESAIDAAFTSPVVQVTFSKLTQTGSTGAPGATQRYRFPTDALQFHRIKATPSASGTGDCSGSSVTAELLS